MNKITMAFLAGLVLVAAGCRWGGIMGNGHIVTDTRSVTDFSEIEANGGFQIEWRSGPPSLSIRLMKIFCAISTTRTSTVGCGCARTEIFGQATESKLPSPA